MARHTLSGGLRALLRRKPRALLVGNVGQEPYCNNLLPIVNGFSRWCTVEVLEPRSIPGFSATGGARPAPVPEGPFLEMVHRHRPRLVVCLGGGLVLSEAARSQLPPGTVTVGLALSDPLGLEASLAIAGSFDLFYTQDPNTLPHYEAAGLSVRPCLPAVDPELYRPVPGGEPCDVLFVGKWTPYRAELLEALAGRCTVRIHTREGETRFGLPVHPPLNSPAELARAFSAARLALETALVEQPGSPLDGSHRLTNRPQFAAACGTPSLSEPFANLPLLFEPGREIATYRDGNELVEVALRLLGESRQRQRMGRRARRRVLRCHTWKIRAREILEEVERLRLG